MFVSIERIVAKVLRKRSCERIVAKSDPIIGNSAATGMRCDRTEGTCAATFAISGTTGVTLAETRIEKGKEGIG
jgi:hypothetical protein